MAWELDCESAGIACPFMIRVEDKNELASIVQQHLKYTHQKSMSKEEILSSAKEV
ncbi:Protein of unknown function (DUF1059) [Candidatus Methanoperedens nitroreducens]|uniref:Small metal-binding protein n=1 Tax=Candidatus Methanoperedens nitratireducens TaxID=1392998 RepID=A0A062V0V3_9EURY|nr:DUF1059 domain-containing protein [Candidatus Methanoperedens nitroreducens]KCZ70992.1 Protein of unknown function (DUF1059) [Candidatus Methanoperedens nitroreducens]MDJ1421638.1 DUF1059 domain-containing protein [Candidatus Methanoperedens sp.]